MLTYFYRSEMKNMIGICLHLPMLMLPKRGGVRFRRRLSTAVYRVCTMRYCPHCIILYKLTSITTGAGAQFFSYDQNAPWPLVDDDDFSKMSRGMMYSQLADSRERGGKHPVLPPQGITILYVHSTSNPFSKPL